MDSAHLQRPDHVLGVNTVIEADRVVIHMWGDIDRANAATAEAAIVGGIRMSPRVDLDLGGVTFIDSFGLRALLEGRAHAAADDVVTIAAASHPVTRLLVMTGLDVPFGMRVSFT